MSLYLHHLYPLPDPSPVKIEPDDTDSPFIMELASPSDSPESPDSYPDHHSSAPPAEVPLRATQASKEMRRMMGVFRLNPFAMHSLSRGADTDDSPDASPTASLSWSGEAGPLDHEPVMFEFQLHISGRDPEDDRPLLRSQEPSSRLPTISAHDESQLRAFSPTFELHDPDLSDPSDRPSSDTRYDIQHDGNDHHPMQEEDPGTDFRQAPCEPWEEVDYAPHAGSDSGASSSTTVSVQTPVNEIGCSPFDDPSLAHIQDHFSARGPCPEQTQISPTVEFSSTSLWDVPQVLDNYQVQENSRASPSVNYGHTDIPHPNSSHSYMRMTYPSSSYTRQYPQPSSQFQQTQIQPNFFPPSLLHNAHRSGPQESNSPNQEIEHVPQSPSTLSPLSPVTPNSTHYSSLNQQQQQQRGHYQSQQSPSHHQPQHHQMPVYSASNPVTPTSMPLRLPISIARSAMRSAAAFSNAASPTSCQSQLPPQSPYSMHSNGRGYRVSRRPQLEERIAEDEVYSTPQSPVIEEGYGPSTTVVTIGMPPISTSMHPVLQRSSTYAGGHTVPHLATGGATAASPVHGHANANSRRWSLPEMSVGAYTANTAIHGESFLGHHM